MNSELKPIIETILLAADTSLTPMKIQGLFDEEGRPELDDIKKSIEELEKDCELRGVELKKIGQGYRYQTKLIYAQYIRTLYQTKPPKMSRALLETVAIIAYKQPVTRGDIEGIRGVSVSSELLHKLLERQWVKEIGVRDVPGRPTLFGTTGQFLSSFNLTSLKDLPSLADQRKAQEVALELEEKIPNELLIQLTRTESELNEKLDDKPSLEDQIETSVDTKKNDSTSADTDDLSLNKDIELVNNKSE